MAEITPGQPEPTPVVFSKETMQEFARAIAFEIDKAERSAAPGSSPSSSASSARSARSGQRSGASTLEKSESDLMGDAFGKAADPFAFRTAQREAAFIEEQRAADGLLPTYFGGKIGWQQINKLAIERMMDKNSVFNSLHGTKFYDMALWADQNPVVVQKGLDAIKGARAMNARQMEFGQQLGAQPGSGFGSSIGPFRPGFINPAARQSIGANIESRFTSAVTPGITPKEDLQLKADLADVGFFDGSQDAKNLLGSGDIFGAKGGLRELYQLDPRIADVEMLTKGTRYGGSTVEEMTKMMKEIPDAAKAANTGIEDMIDQMKQAGQAAEDAGGSYRQGADAAKNFSERMGMPPAIYNTIKSSPLVEGRIFAQTGLPPFMQGAMPAAGQEIASMQAFQDISNSMGTFEDRFYTLNGTEHRLSGNKVKAQMLQQQFPDLSTQQIENLLEPGKLEDYMASAQVDLKAEEIIAGEPGSGRRGDMRDMMRLMRQSKTADGNELFEQEDIDAVKDAKRIVRKDNGEIDLEASGFLEEKEFLGKKIGLPFGLSKSSSSDKAKRFIEFAEKEVEVERLDGESDEEFLKRIGSNKRLTNDFARREGAKKLTEITDAVEKERQEEEKTNANSISLDLTPEAKKWLRKIDPVYANKERVGRGADGTVNNLGDS